MRHPLVVANWKNNTRLADAVVLATGVRNALEDLEQIEAVLCPPLPWVTAVHEIAGSVPNLSVGVQDLSAHPPGPYTGEVAASLLREVVQYAIIGHSERQYLYRETIERLQEKISAALADKITPILCVGENRRSSAAVKELTRRLALVVKHLTPRQKSELVVAFEPIWAISPGKAPVQAATPEYANDAAEALRVAVMADTRILYGGSVTATNAASFVSQPEISGVLVGGASLKLREFNTLLKNVASRSGQ